MSDIGSLINGAEKLIEIFGYWPSFHDAEIIDVHLWRGVVEPEKNRYIFPVLTVKLHLWELTDNVNADGGLMLQNHSLVTLRFHDIENDIVMEGFNHHNAVFELSIKQKHRNSGPSPGFEVEFSPCFGFHMTFRCSEIEVLEVLPCDENGKSHS